MIDLSWKEASVLAMPVKKHPRYLSHIRGAFIHFFPKVPCDHSPANGSGNGTTDRLAFVAAYGSYSICPVLGKSTSGLLALEVGTSAVAERCCQDAIKFELVLILQHSPGKMWRSLT
jgi:hypothetical protein